MAGAVVQTADGYVAAGASIATGTGTGSNNFSSNVTLGNVLMVMVSADGPSTAGTFTFSKTGTATIGTATQAQALLMVGYVTGTKTLVGGSAYVNGTYYNVPMTGGSGAGLTMNVTVSGGAVTSIVIVNVGHGYLTTDTGLTCANTYLGGSGSGFSFAIQYNQSDYHDIQFFTIPVTGSGSLTLTANYSSTQGLGIQATELSGISAATPISANSFMMNVADVGTGSTMTTSNSPPLSGAGNLIAGYCFVANENATAAPTAGSGFTGYGPFWKASGAGVGQLLFESMHTTASTSVTASAVVNSNFNLSYVMGFPLNDGGAAALDAGHLPYPGPGISPAGRLQFQASPRSAFSAATLTATGSAAITEGADAAAGTGSGFTIASLGALPMAGPGIGPDSRYQFSSFAFNTTLAPQTLTTGVAAISEGSDTVAGTGVSSTTGTAAITEGADTVAGVGVTGGVGIAAITELADTVAGVGSTKTTGVAAIIESSDIVVANGTAGAGQGAGAITEGQDIVAGVGTAIPAFVTLYQANFILANAGFVVSPVYVYTYSTTVPNGYVITEMPPAGTVVTFGTPVQLTVSLGPPNNCPTTVTVPSVVGLGVILAEQLISTAQLNVGTITWTQSSTVRSGIVISQTPEGGSLDWSDANIFFDDALIDFSMTGYATYPIFGTVNLIVSNGRPQNYPGTGTLTVPTL